MSIDYVEYERGNSVTIELPWPPTVNLYWGSRIVRKPGGSSFIQRYISANGKKFHKESALRLRERFGGKIRPSRERIGVYAVMHPPTRGTYDLGNFDKALMDTLTSVGVWADDSQIDDQRFVRGRVIKGGKVVLTIWEIKDQTPRLFDAGNTGELFEGDE